MTSRLKRKLNDLGVDTAGSKATENFCLIGTPLPLLDKSRDTGEFVPIWKQDVRDEKGRRRLHGAFTGGFSAGYFNSVGSKEGWAPATFTSSRTDRSKKKTARPEDFMDEEDLAELRDSQKLVDTTEEMDLDFWDRSRKIETGETEKDSITSTLEATLLPAPRDSVGAQILKKMGWRLGHGIGPKVTYEQRKRQLALLQGASALRDNQEDAGDHEEAKKHLYPALDTKVPSFRKKDNRHGLGYAPGKGLMEIESAESSDKAGQEASISAGFGLGALNDADEDDLDVYDRDSVRVNRRLAYDEDEDKERIIISSRSKIARKDRPISLKASTLNNQAAGRRTAFRNGVPCLPQFMIAEKPVTEDQWFPPPKVPEGWSPNPQRVWMQDKENIKTAQDTAVPPEHDQGWRKAGLTHAQRGNLLGEKPLANTRSIFDYLAPKDRERLKNLATERMQPESSTSTEPGPMPAPPKHEQTFPRLDPQVAKMALQGFQPFTTDPMKQSRYTMFLQAQATGADSVPFGRAPGQAEDSFARELQDYARSAQIFKPVSGAMAGRFTRAAIIDTGPKAIEGLHQPVEEGSYLSMPAEVVEEKKEESAKENAARLGMFGPLTRETKSWMPAKLLCKRFGLKEPIVELPKDTSPLSAPSGGADWQNGGVLSLTDVPEAESAGATKIEEGDSLESSLSTRKGWHERDIGNIGLGEDPTQGRDILTYQRPEMDIFKAIFASDDEGEDENDDVAGEAEIDLKGDKGHKSDDIDRENIGIILKVDEPEISKHAEPIASTSAPTSQLPIIHVDYNDAAGKVDMASFKPTFVPRSDRQKTKDREKKDKGKDKDRERKKKKGKTVLVSFQVDEEGGDVSLHSQEKEKDGEKKRKKKRKAEASVDDDENIWVEKPPPAAVQNIAASEPILADSNTIDYSGLTAETEAGPPRGRKRAIDFM
ncbi:hypothetical protein EW145_g253 [Phellinidium pouzarii]|uniref:G-patch domain-containing protein n=1 Tax=Phellinidium pouzarii TaxID=167371 RepID=A0A4S4LJ41_9AGAM|nr:hypothetical protein EW145_g253 [Phellinidium pouzarii]